MSESERSTSVLDGLIVGDPISQHHGVQCCPAIRESTNERYIVKILSIPTSSVQMDALLLTGAYSSSEHALTYFRQLADEVLEEVDILRRLNAMEGFLPYTESEVRKKEDSSGYQVYLVSPYKRSLERQMQLEPLTHLGAVNLGLDLCAALAICRRAGYLYLDLKPSNVFITPNQGYRISDLGFVSLSSLKYASFPEQYRSIYTAPEIADAMSSLNSRIDIYALGLILYQVYNNGQLPTEAIEAGQQLPPPMYADYEIAEIILKACDPNPTRRWADPLQMGKALVSYMQRNSINDTPIVPPPVDEPVTEPVEEVAEEPVEEVAEEPVEEPVSVPAEELEDADSAVPVSVEEEIAKEEQISESLGAMLEKILEKGVAAEKEKSVDIDLDEAPAPDPALDLSFMDEAPEDETIPTEESAADIQEELVSDEVQQMLARADELISHELPEPAVAPEPIEVPFPAPIVLPQEEPEEEPEEEAEASAEPEEADEDEEEAPEEACEPQEEEPAAQEPEATEQRNTPAEQKNTFANSDHSKYEFSEEKEGKAVEWTEECEVSEYYSNEQIHLTQKAKSKTRALITVACSIVLLIALLASGVLFYQYYYLQNVAGLSVDGSVDSLTTVIQSNIRDELLTVTCTDTYGNTYYQAVINGRAHFTNLKPNTQYRVQLSISGFHKLTGITSDSYTTLAQTEILNFTAVGGPDNGSAILSFTVNGPDLDTWTVGYSTGNAPEITQSFSGHSVTISNLTVGSEYLFRLIPDEDQHLAGNWQVKFTATQLVSAQELAIRSCADGTLVAVWDVPEGSENQSWNVRCYNDNGYDQTITTNEGQAQFTELDHAFGYTVEVTAVGMSQSATATVSANPITLKDMVASQDTPGALTVKWTIDGEIPADGWILDYSIDGGEPVTVSCTENTTELPLFPGSEYKIDLRPAGEVSFFGKPLTYTAEAAQKFSGYGVTADDMSFYMCLTPKKENWDRFDVPAPDYKTAFPVGVRASFLVEVWKNYEYSEDTIIITYVIRDEAGHPVSRNSMETAWNLLWDKKFCELDIPEMPGTAGNYTVDIFFNNQLITSEPFSVI